MAKTRVAAHYSKMAYYYDEIYATIVDYEKQTRFLEKIIGKHLGRRPRSVLDIACGTGNYTFVFAKHGYRATGIDVSEEMLKIARGKVGGQDNPRFYKMDMRKIRLDQRSDVATVLFGGFGYLEKEEDVRLFFSSVSNHLNRRGLLMFEFWQNSAVLPASTGKSGMKSWDRAETGDRLIVRLNLSRYDPHTNVLDVKFDFYIMDRKKKELVDEFSETHRVRTYSISHMRALLEHHGLKALAFYDADLARAEKGEVAPAFFSTFRVMAVARRGR